MKKSWHLVSKLSKVSNVFYLITFFIYLSLVKILIKREIIRHLKHLRHLDKNGGNEKCG